MEFRKYLCTKYKIPQNSLLLFFMLLITEKSSIFKLHGWNCKRNDFIIKSLHDYYKQIMKKVYLFLTEYGPDVSETKNLLKN